jgi:hypothetical protein
MQQFLNAGVELSSLSPNASSAPTGQSSQQQQHAYYSELQFHPHHDWMLAVANGRRIGESAVYDLADIDAPPYTWRFDDESTNEVGLLVHAECVKSCHNGLGSRS